MSAIDETIDGQNDWRISTLTYNINGQKPTSDIISKWLDHERDLQLSTIVAVALQEISHAEIFSAVSRRESWTDALNEWFYAHRLVLVGREQLASNLLLVYCLPRVLISIARLDYKWTRTTFAGYKGTVSCRLFFKNGLSLVFLASHFIHGEENLNLRLEQYKNSLSCTFDDESSLSATKLNRDGLPRHVVFWMGDFNFRVEGYKNTPESLIKLLWNTSSPKNFNTSSLVTELIEHYDQLTKCRCSGKVFKGFQEPIITFLPTYRIMVDNGAYDPLRMPSWCDRILYKVSSKLTGNVSVLKYSSCRQISASDHFPVLAAFRLRDQKDLYRRFSQSGQRDRLSRDPLFRWSCVFSSIPTWASAIPFVCRFSVDTLFWRTSAAYRDWLGVYAANIGAVTKPLYWIYAFTCYNDDTANINSSQSSQSLIFSDRTNATTSQSSSSSSSSRSSNSESTVLMVAEFPPLPPGSYRVGYFSIQRDCLQGLSDVFLVSPASEHL